VCYDAASFRDLFSSKKLSSENPIDLTRIAELTVRGGWPGNLSVAKSKQAILPLSYINSIADDDISRYDGVERSPTITSDIIKAIARNNQTLVTNRTLIKDASNISEPTFTSYFDVLQKLFVVDNIPAWAPNLRSPLRLRTSPKVRLVDPSLAVAALGMTADKLIGDLETFGFMFESLCTRDIKAFAENMDAKLFHYRENAAPGKKEYEIDLIVELADGEWGGIEIKLGASQIEEAEQNLLGISERLQRNGARPPKCLAVISGLSSYAYTTKNGVKVVPIGCLKP
jgi:predicted AAA+ superfamily ATPase